VSAETGADPRIRPDVVEAVTRSRLEQGLPPTIEDPTTLAKVATLMGAER
jgi:hypothetical protein